MNFQKKKKDFDILWNFLESRENVLEKLTCSNSQTFN